jgi:molybdate transport system substrate-binding protein
LERGGSRLLTDRELNIVNELASWNGSMLKTLWEPTVALSWSYEFHKELWNYLYGSSRDLSSFRIEYAESLIEKYLSGSKEAYKILPKGFLEKLAAASLADVLPRIGDEWERLGGTPLVFSFDATSRLAVQASLSGSGDVFFSADPQWIRWLEEQGTVSPGSAIHFAANDLVIAVSRDISVPVQPNMLSVFSRIALAGENVPAGKYARTALEQAGVWSELEGRIVRGGSVRGALEWVARDEVPAGIVYRTDAEAEPSVRIAFVFEGPGYPQVQYWGVPLGSTVYEKSAVDFVNFVLGDSGQPFLREAGFSPPQSDIPDGEEERYAAGDTGDDLVASVSSAVRLSLIVAFLATLVGLVPAIGLG